MKRRGVTLTELIVTMLLLGSAMAAVVPVVQWASTQRQAARQREFALQEAAGILEDLTAREWHEITPEHAEQIAPTESARAMLRDPELTVTVNDASDAASPGKRIVVELRWKDHAGRPAAPARLTTWVYKGSD
ncbi:MAG: type II secretion system protein [Planctomycetaceae bacterium]